MHDSYPGCGRPLITQRHPEGLKTSPYTYRVCYLPVASPQKLDLFCSNSSDEKRPAKHAAPAKGMRYMFVPPPPTELASVSLLPFQHSLHRALKMGASHHPEVG